MDEIAALVAREAALIEALVELTMERDSYRLVAQQAIHALHAAQQATKGRQTTISSG